MTSGAHFSPERAEAEHTPWGSLTWLVNDDLIKGSELSFGIVTIKPGQSNPVHTHPNCEEIVYVLSGVCEQLVGESRVVLNAGEGIVVPREVEHGSVNVGDELLVVLVCCSSAVRETVFRDGDSVAY